MILVDTSAWVDHLRRSDHSLATHLESGQRGTHRFVIGELPRTRWAGSLQKRNRS